MDVLRILDPATGALVGEAPDRGAAGVEAAVARARQAQPAWGALPFAERRRALRRLVARLRDDRALVETLVAESGKPHYEAEAIEVFYTCEVTRYYTSGAGRRALADQVRHPLVFSNKRARIIRHPRGVVGVIGPWNWPLLNNFADAVAALVCGNAVVLKPSEWTPLTSLAVEKLWRAEALPDGVFQVVTGRASAGQALVERADMIVFTGSETVGRQVAARCGERLVPAVIELGGKSPMIVLRDADLPRAARAAVWSAFAHSGQVCIRTERVLVEEVIGDRFIELCAEAAGHLRQGPPGQGASDPDVGAITFPRQVEVAERHIADALARGARVVTGGKRRADLPGRFFEPTILANVTPEMAVMTEETFAPVLPIMKVAGPAEALEIANASRFGLSGSVWSADLARARALARRLDAGSVCVNDVLFNYFCVEAPFGGIKASGLGLRHGPEALQQFCRTETVIEDHPVLGLLSGFLFRQLSFPYKPAVLRLLRWVMKRIY